MCNWFLLFRWYSIDVIIVFGKFVCLVGEISIRCRFFGLGCIC